jgi:hypothetical protein
LPCHSACKFGSDATLVQPWSCSAYQAGLKQVELGASVHLTLDQFELGDLALGLSVGPRRRDRGVDGSLVLEDTVGKRRDEACTCSLQPWFKIYVSLLADHRMESGYDLSSFHQERNALLDRRNGDGLRL